MCEQKSDSIFQGKEPIKIEYGKSFSFTLEFPARTAMFRGGRMVAIEEGGKIMPTYEYLCPKCGERADVWHGMTKNPVILCCCCDTPMERQIGKGAAVIFRGPGFHINDYPKNPKDRKERR